MNRFAMMMISTVKMFIISLALSFLMTGVCFAQTIPEETRQLVNKALSGSVSPDSALGVLESILVKQRNNAEAYFLSGLIHEKLNQYDEAVLILKIAIDEKRAPKYLMALGRVQFKAGNIKEAERILTGAKEKASENENTAVLADIYYWLGRIYEHQKQTTQAIDAYRQALQHNPNHQDAQQRLQALAPPEKEEAEPPDVSLKEEGVPPQIDKPASDSLESSAREVNRDMPRSDAKTRPKKKIESSNKSIVNTDAGLQFQFSESRKTEITKLAPRPLDTTRADSSSPVSPSILDTVEVKNLVQASLLRAWLQTITARWRQIAVAAIFVLVLAVVFMLPKLRFHKVAGKTGALVIPTPALENDDPRPRAAVSPKSSVPELIDRYRIGDRLGEGGVGVVHKAFDARLDDRVVAIKFLRLDFQSEKEIELRKARFERAWRILAPLDHPNIVRLLDRGEVEGNDVFRFYIVMEYVDGLSLDRMIEKQGPLPVELTFDIIRETLKALDYAHRNRVIHRDLKPANIMRHKEGWTKVLDFDIAKVMGREDTRMLTGQQRPGTYDYMSPEQQTPGAHVDHRSDIFSLGIVYYEMLLGNLPNDSEVRVGQKSPEFHLRRPDVPIALNGIVAKMLALNPAERYQTARQVLDALSSDQNSKGRKS